MSHLRSSHPEHASPMKRKKNSTEGSSVPKRRRMESKGFETVLRPGFRREYEINIFEDSVHYDTVIHGMTKEMEDIIREARHEFQALTILSHMCAEFRRTNEDGSDEFQHMLFVIPRILLMLQTRSAMS